MSGQGHALNRIHSGLCLHACQVRVMHGTEVILDYGLHAHQVRGRVMHLSEVILDYGLQASLASVGMLRLMHGMHYADLGHTV